MTIINSEPNFNGSQHVIQVDAQTDKPETVTIEYDKPSCTNGDDSCPSILVDGGEYLNQKITKSPFKLSAVPNTSKFPEDSSGNPFMSLAKFIADVFIPSNSIVNPNIYTIKTQGCGDISNNIAEVHCYPTMGWSGEIYAGRTAEREEKFSFQYDANNQLKTAALPVDQKTSFTYGGEFSLGINGRNFKPIKYTRSDDSASGNFILRRIENTVSGLLDSIDLIGKIGDKIGITPAKFIIKPPNVAIGGDMKAVEHPTSGVIDYEGRVYLKAKPLLAINFEIEFFNILIIMAGGATAGVGGPAAAKFIIDMREKFKTGVGSSTSNFEAKGDFYAKLGIEGSVGGSLIWTSQPGKNIVIEQGEEEGDDLDENKKRSSYTKGEMKGQVGITLKAGAYAEGRLLKISVKAGIGIGISGAKDTSDPVGLFVTLAASSEENKPTLSGNVEFSGLQIYYIKFAEMSRKEGVSNGKNNSGWKNSGGDYGKKKSIVSNLEDARTLYTVIEAKKLWEFGQGDAPTSQALNQV